MRGHELSGLVPNDPFVMYETKYWQVNQRADATLPAYLMVSAKESDARELEDLSAGALRELGCALRAVTAALRASFKPEHIHICRFGHSPDHSGALHIIPVYAWMKEAYRRMAGEGEEVRYPSFTDGASLTLFVSEEFTRGRAPCAIPEPNIENTIQTLRDALSREAAQQTTGADR
jgi:diadenosine tetraphosphate (Ap4A) HIT family hydrolase